MERNQKAAMMKQLKQNKEYYELVRNGGLFLRFIHQDFKKRAKTMNRAERRRWDVSLKKKGLVNDEIIQHYLNRSEEVLMYVNKELRKLSGEIKTVKK
jgi:hypothetical protein